ncbi:MAG: aminotransferase class V-fold PLP-dependent enzyme [Gallionellaceae bacterium]|jgi:aspartate aminotransferase-like enzyme|nr:aminotransferase class V-fold PLP-dependent enzyme [Gallionellaceae bacterium]
MYSSQHRQRIYTPGPVQMAPDILEIGGMQTPYFRNAAFSEVVLDCETKLLELANAPSGSRVAFLTASGTAAMEAAVMNLLTPARSVGIVNGGSFGQRFVEICAVHGVPVQELKVDRDPLSDGVALSELRDVDALLVNAHETSVGHLYDLAATGDWCRRHGALHIVDAISLFVSDPLDMQAQHIDVLIISSHKGLALPPGLAMVLLSPRALERVHPSGSYYLDFGSHLHEGERGQTPFTPAISIILQLQHRLTQLHSQGLNTEWQRAASVAARFRMGIAELPLVPYSAHMPNAMTALQLTNEIPAPWVVGELESRHGCVVAPNGGKLSDIVFRVSHMGAQDLQDADFIVNALMDVLGESK